MKATCMQGVKQLETVRRTPPQHITRTAWLVLICAFTLFCAMIATSGYLVWHYRQVVLMERPGTTLIARAPLEWITWKRRERAFFESPPEEQVLSEGDRVRINRSAGYGQAATIRIFDQSTLDMWAGADLLLHELRVSQWNTRTQVVRLEQLAGYVRYDLRDDQAYAQVTYQVQAGATTIELAPGGSYSIELIDSERVFFTATTEPVPTFAVDVAVRSGRATVQGIGRTVVLEAGERVEVDPSGVPSIAVPARWELIRDGNFTHFTEVEYNNTTIADQPTLPRADTWEVYSVRAEPGATPNGFFQLLRSCPPPYATNTCNLQDWRHVARFVRTGNESRSFITGIRQPLGHDRRGIDVSEYRSLVFSAWVRILQQSVPLAGQRGTECPIMLRFMAKRTTPNDPETERVLCVYAQDDPARQAEYAPGIIYQAVAPTEWYPLRIELRDRLWLPDFRYIRSVSIYANGHDYDVLLTDVSLIGAHDVP